MHCWVEISEVTTPIGEWVRASDGGFGKMSPKNGAQSMTRTFLFNKVSGWGVQMFTVFNNTWDDYGEYIIYSFSWDV